MGNLGELIVDAHHGKDLREALNLGTLIALAPHFVYCREDPISLVEMRHILGIDFG